MQLSDRLCLYTYCLPPSDWLKADSPQRQVAPLHSYLSFNGLGMELAAGCHTCNDQG